MANSTTLGMFFSDFDSFYDQVALFIKQSFAYLLLKLAQKPEGLKN